jgi:DNA-binding transcriptional LysR family regulator
MTYTSRTVTRGRRFDPFAFVAEVGAGRDVGSSARDWDHAGGHTMRKKHSEPSTVAKADEAAIVAGMGYDLTDLRLFVQVVDAGSITRGADRAHLALATASARITSMEKALGAPLLVRHRRGVTPSPVGWVLVGHARLILADVARMEAELAHLTDGLPSTLVVMANTSATETFAFATVAEIMRLHPDIAIEVKQLPSQRTVEAVTNGRAELGLIADTVDVGALECRMLRPDPLVLRRVRAADVGALLPLLGSVQWGFHQCGVLPISTSFASPTTASRTTTWTWWRRPVSEMSARTRGYEPRWTCSPTRSAGWVRYSTSGAAQAP